MYEIFRATEDGLIISSELEKDSWIRISNPTPDEIEFLSDELDIPPAFISDPLDADERARIEVEEKATLVIIRVPCFEGEESDIPYTTIPLGIITTGEYVLTVSSRPLPQLLDFVDSKVRTFSYEARAGFVLQIFLRTALLYLRYLRDVNKRTDIIERELHKSLRNEELIKLLNLEKSLVYFTTSLRANQMMMERFERTRIRMSEEDKDSLEDLLIENKQAIEMANIYSNILSGMMDAFASIINNNVSLVMKFLTSVTIIFMIPTFVSSTYGMNVALPFQQSPYAFLYVTGISLALSLLGVWIFWKRRWF